MILLSHVNSPLKLIQNVPTRPCCILSVNSPSSSLCLHPTPWQAGTLSHIQMERSSHHCSVDLIVLVLDFFAVRNLRRPGGRGGWVVGVREIYARFWGLQLVEKQHGQCRHPAVWQGLSGHFTEACTCERACVSAHTHYRSRGDECRSRGRKPSIPEFQNNKLQRTCQSLISAQWLPDCLRSCVSDVDCILSWKAKANPCIGLIPIL